MSRRKPPVVRSGLLKPSNCASTGRKPACKAAIIGTLGMLRYDARPSVAIVGSWVDHLEGQPLFQHLPTSDNGHIWPQSQKIPEDKALATYSHKHASKIAKGQELELSCESE